METELGKLANSLVEDAKQNKLTRLSLYNFYYQSRNNFNDIVKFNCEDFKNAGALFLFMLKLENDIEVRQSISAMGYYILSYGINNETLDKIGIPIKLLDYIGLLKIRLFLLLNSVDNLKYTIRMIPERVVVDKYFSPLMDNFTSEQASFTDMALSDAGEIKKWGSVPAITPMVLLVEQEAINIATKVINDNSPLLRETTIENKIVEGKKVHAMLYQYLDKKLRVEKSYTFDDED